MQLSITYWLSVWRERATAFDPGLTNLLLAARATASVMLTLLILYLLTQLLRLSPTLLLIGGAMAMFSVIAVNDSARRQQIITSALLPLPAMASITAGTLLAALPFAADAVFVVIIFAAVYVRRFGPRAFAFGMIGFIAYFIGMILAPEVGALPWLFVAICIGDGSGFLMRYVLLPERPRHALKRMLRAFIALSGRTLDDVITALESGNTAALRSRSLRRHQMRLNEIAIATESQLEKVLPGTDQSSATRTRLALAILDLELRTERVVVTCAESTNAAAQERALYALRALRVSIRNRSLSSAHELAALRVLQHAPLERAVRNLAHALSLIAKARLNAPTLADSQLEVPADEQTGSDEDISKPASDTADKNHAAHLSPATRQAIQAAIAGILAIGLGELVSPHRWYWAAIAAFVVFTGTNSRGELLVKSWQRIAGTVLGVVAGVLIGTAVQGATLIEAALMPVCIFSGYYLLRVSYALMIFWITILVSIVYAMLGFFSEHLLLLRLEETAVGVAAGVVVSVLLLPVSVRSRATADSREFLAMLADAVAASGELLAGGRPNGNLAVRARALDRQFQQLRSSARPLTRGIAGAFSRKGARRWIRSLMACRYYTASLARATQRAPATGLDWPPGNEFADAVAHISTNIRTLAGMCEQADDTEIESAAKRIEKLLEALPDDDGNAGNTALQREVLDSLGRIDRIVTTLAQDYGTLHRS